MKVNLKIVRQEQSKAQVYDSARGKRRMIFIRDQLMAAAVRYVKDGTDGCRADRLRTASNLSGIPLVLIDTQSRR